MLFDTAFVESSNFRDILYYVNYQCFNHHFFSIIVCLNNNRNTELNRCYSVKYEGVFWRVDGTTPAEGNSTLHLFPITNVNDFLGSQHASTAVTAGSDAEIGRNFIRFGFKHNICLLQGWSQHASTPSGRNLFCTSLSGRIFGVVVTSLPIWKSTIENLEVVPGPVSNTRWLVLYFAIA